MVSLDHKIRILVSAAVIESQYGVGTNVEKEMNIRSINVLILSIYQFEQYINNSRFIYEPHLLGPG